MKNFSKMMKQAQEMQAKVARMQEDMDNLEIEGQAGGGMVTLIMTGKLEMKRIKLDKSLINPEEIDMLEDLIIAAHNDACSKIEKAIASETQDIMGGMNLPKGLNLPF